MNRAIDDQTNQRPSWRFRLRFLVAIMFGVSALCSEWGVSAATAEEKQEYGSIHGRMIFEGKIPPGKTHLVLGENGGIPNLAVFIISPINAIHESYRREQHSPTKIVIRNGKFEPEMAVIWTERPTKISLVGQFPEPLQSFGPMTTVDFIVHPQDSYTILGWNPEKIPITVTSLINVQMKGWFVVRDHPYAVATDKDGNFELRDVPVGRHQIRVWHEALKWSPPIDKGGRIEVDVKANERQDLGDFRFNASQLYPFDDR